jgi:hypothetical protein
MKKSNSDEIQAYLDKLNAEEEQELWKEVRDHLAKELNKDPKELRMEDLRQFVLGAPDSVLRRILGTSKKAKQLCTIAKQPDGRVSIYAAQGTQVAVLVDEQ